MQRLHPICLHAQGASSTASTHDSDALPASYEAAPAGTRTAGGRDRIRPVAARQLLAGYQRGAALLKFCRDKLQAVEDQIKVLDAGSLKPWTQE